MDRFPELTFESRSVVRDGGAFRVAGELTIRDVTREVELEVVLILVRGVLAAEGLEDLLMWVI